MMILKDPLYGFISIESPFKSLIETAQFQRLRNIKQLGQSYLIYPSANHSRFEHSIGVFYLASKIAEKMEISRRGEFVAAALLHDIGHYPFSHAIEKSIGLTNGATHEEQALKIIRGREIGGILKKAKIDISRVCDLILGMGELGKLISGQIDVDRLDYLKRDSYYTGVAYGVIETDLILKSFIVKGKKYFVDEKYLPAFESVLIARYLMYSMVYMHRKTLVANAMLRAAFRHVMSAREILPEQLIKFDDIDFVGALRSSGTPAADLINQIHRRKLYEEAIIFKKEDFGGDISAIKKIKDISIIEEDLAEELKIKNHEILVNILNFPQANEGEIFVSPSGEKLEKISPMVRALDSAEWNHWFTGIYCPQKHLGKIKKAKKIIKSYLLTQKR